MINKKQIEEKAVFDECIELYGNKTKEDFLQLLEQNQSRAVRNTKSKFENDCL